ncbi:peroxisomal 2 4-dienoyl-CoA reductase sps19 [Cryomyces antarcticus]|uniref:2,4-dienoyl-CoA reductase [(3E)-enoyl-CoA-producing] n=1 Tax=Cryomyces antarcticus TaxID=329879 RepID=A0ABR0LS20_9PEZI|nr:peroxisomal 2 4-dienoyl-CoA reductase sps19 [Cryomyces antarcticus]KAK5019536.1 peroxisomal 2 4-dienoyl-CoA reductase sps19 [Cryomyces antarcticus]KAK5201688.1 peroxisomal 2 4-dienoyl-CoA reductase sps19 [Cryomyces antarcticus]
MTGMALQTHASVAKAGINALSGNIAIEMGPLGVTSNVVVPGGIEGTEGMDRLSVADETESSISLIPLGKLGTVKDIADATVYLFSDAGSYVNGDILTVDGGAWRTSGGMLGRAMKYPDFFLSDEDVKAARKGAKAKL